MARRTTSPASATPTRPCRKRSTMQRWPSASAPSTRRTDRLKPALFAAAPVRRVSTRAPEAWMTTRAIDHNPTWTVAMPLASVLLLVLAWLMPATPGLVPRLVIGLGGSVIASVHHAEVIAHRVGEPFGTIVLALAVTVIEVALIVSMMLSGGESSSALARDTVYAAVMIILNGMIGISLLAGARRHFEQGYHVQGVTAGLATLIAIVVFSLILPNYVTSSAGPLYTNSQLIFISIAILVLFGGFTFVQTVRHRDYFLPATDADDARDPDGDDSDDHVEPPTVRETFASVALLLLALVVVVLSAKKISPSIESLLASAGAPAATVGILIAAVVLLPEGIAAV